MATKVSLVRCDDYDARGLDRALDKALRKLDGLPSLIKHTDRVFIKVNHLGNHPVDTAINTHPALALAVVRFLREFTSHLVIGDGLESEGMGNFATSGYLSTFDDGIAELVNLRGEAYPETEIAEAKVLPKAPIARTVLEADVLVTLPKLKTHCLTLLTGGVKNSYGQIPHGLRKNLHREFISPVDFSRMLVDLYTLKVPKLAIMDAVTALEGYGPSRGGSPRHVGLLIASLDGVALDSVSSKVIGYEPEEIHTTKIATERGVGEGRLDQIEIVGERLEEVVVRDFRQPENTERALRALGKLPSPILSALSHIAETTKQIPRVVEEKCTGCGLCAEHCPREAIQVIRGKARIDSSNCIECYCCAEFCQNDAIRLVYTGLGGAIVKTGKAFSAVKKVFRRKR